MWEQNGKAGSMNWAYKIKYTGPEQKSFFVVFRACTPQKRRIKRTLRNISFRSGLGFTQDATASQKNIKSCNNNSAEKVTKQISTQVLKYICPVVVKPSVHDQPKMPRFGCWLQDVVTYCGFQWVVLGIG